MADVQAFRGIPYATAGRFEEPVVASFDASAPADRFGPAAPQVADYVAKVPGAPITELSEDCLTLNIWTRFASSSDPSHSPKPVMVWFPGGSFVTGATSQAVYDGARLASDDDVVVVTVNYRLGALGFLDTRSIGGTATNLGLRDAIAALSWVRSNIAHFGGDPECVTAFGESAGAGVVLHVLASTRAIGLLHRAIVQSCAPNTILDTEKSALVARTLCDVLEVDSVDGLRALPADAIAAAQPKVFATLLQSVGMMPFHPCIDADVLHAMPADAFADGVAAGIPLLAGTTSEEMRLFLDSGAEAPARDRLVKRVSRYLEVDAARAETIIDGYASSLGTEDLGEVWAFLFSDAEMQAPLRAALRAHATNGPTYTYLFTWQAPGLGAFHAVDLPFTFGNFDADGWGEFVGADADAERLSRAVRRAWTTFARDGEPGWDGFPTTMVFGRESYVADDPIGARVALLP
jgi:para-nitrobenzyl esterase